MAGSSETACIPFHPKAVEWGQVQSSGHSSSSTLTGLGLFVPGKGNLKAAAHRDILDNCMLLVTFWLQFVEEPKYWYDSQISTDF